MSTWVLLRGLTREIGHWGNFPKQLANAFDGDDIVCIDLPGNGADYRGESPRSVSRMVEHVRHRLSADEQLNVLALSLGGMVAVEWARQFPEEIQSLTLMNTSMRPFSPPWKRLRPKNYPAILTAIMTDDQVKREQTVLRLTSHRHTIANSAQLLSQWVELAHQHPVSRRNTVNQLQAAARYQAPTQIAVPVLVLCGEQDQLVNPSCSYAIAQAWSAPLKVNPQAGHDLALDDPEWVITQITDWQLDQTP